MRIMISKKSNKYRQSKKGSFALNHLAEIIITLVLLGILFAIIMKFAFKPQISADEALAALTKNSPSTGCKALGYDYKTKNVLGDDPSEDFRDYYAKCGACIGMVNRKQSDGKTKLVPVIHLLDTDEDGIPDECDSNIMKPLSRGEDWKDECKTDSHMIFSSGQGITGKSKYAYRRCCLKGAEKYCFETAETK